MNKSILFGIVGVVIVAAIFIVFNLASKPSTLTQGSTSVSTVPSQTAQDQDAKQTSSANTTSNWYTNYTPETLAVASQNNQRAVIFFHASWCPTCRAASADFEANSSQIPNDVRIIRADYDTETTLKQKYGIVSQDTFVQVDANGNEITKWNSGGQGISSLLANLQ